MNTTRDFEFQLDAFRDEDVPEAMFNLMRSVMLTGLTSLVLMTPVDTGRARGNWIVSLGAASYRYQDTSLDPSGSSSIAEGLANAAALKSDPFALVYIQNNLPYIEALEDGSSTQAPNGMVTVTIAKLESEFS